MAGFVSKWYLGMGALEADAPWVIAILLSSSALNAAYFLPIVYRAWFKAPAEGVECVPWTARDRIGAALFWPPLVTCLLALLAGLLAGTSYSPLFWARLITAREYGM